MPASLRRALATAVMPLAVLLPAAPAAEADREPPPDRYTPIVMRVMSAPQWFRGTDGFDHLVYELKLTNGFPLPVDVASVIVLNAATHRSVAELSGDSLTAAMTP